MALNDQDSRGLEDSHPQKLAFFGGGRWGTIFFEELCKHVPENTKLLWVTRDARIKQETWQEKNGHGNIEFLEAWHDRLIECDGAIVANSNDRHYQITRDLLSASVPVLCEKPLAATREQLDYLCSLARQHRCPFGIHLEFAFLSSFDDFLEKSKSVATKRIQVEWFDPEIEIRNGIEKHSEYQCDIVSDQWPHVWSLISRSVRAGVLPQIERLEYSPARTRLIGRLGDRELDVQLSRRRTERRRFISLNEGEATFDFSIEPPTATLRDVPLNLTPPKLRPLGGSIQSFLSQVDAYKRERSSLGSNLAIDRTDLRDALADQDWALSVDKHYEFLVQSFELSEQLRGIQDEIIARTLSDGRWESTKPFQLNDEAIQMVLDRWLPQGMFSGARYRAGSQESDRELALQIVRSLYQRT